MTQTSKLAETERLLALLPVRGKLFHTSLIGAYGADQVAAAYCGVPYTGTPPPGIWQHGWISKRRSFHPASIIGGWGSYEAVKEKEQFWVARRDQEETLRSYGYNFVRAIGLPIVYVRKRGGPRVLGSLLVMPVHSLDTTTHQWDSEEYAEYIASIRHRFSSVVICVHPFCKQKGYWYPAFERRGFRIVEGALGSDSNSWERLRLLFESFEFVTTNGYGSHFVYAAYFGAKPSICGPYAQVRAEDFRDSPLYQDVPEILEPMLEACSEEVVRKDYPFLFVEPQKATTHISWAEQEVGADCRVSPAELRALFKWTLAHRLRASIGQSIRRAHRLPRRLSQRLRAFAGNNA